MSGPAVAANAPFNRYAVDSWFSSCDGITMKGKFPRDSRHERKRKIIGAAVSYDISYPGGVLLFPSYTVRRLDDMHVTRSQPAHEEKNDKRLASRGL